MTTCPRCGRDADDEFVCAECGAFLAGEETAAASAVSVRRVVVLVLIVCVLGAGGAALLLGGGGGGGHRDDLSIPLVSSPVELSNAPLGAPGETGSLATSGSATARPTTSLATSGSATSTRSSSATGSAARTTSAAPRSSGAPSTRPSSPRPTSTSPAPHPSTSHSTSKPPSSTPRSSPPPAPEVHLAKGALATCGPHCFALVVTLVNFSAGAHTVSCFSGHDGQFDSYTTSSTTSSECTYRRPNDTVHVVVDGHTSNAVTW